MAEKNQGFDVATCLIGRGKYKQYLPLCYNFKGFPTIITFLEDRWSRRKKRSDVREVIKEKVSIEEEWFTLLWGSTFVEVFGLNLHDSSQADGVPGLGTKYLSHSLDPSCHQKLWMLHQMPARILHSEAGTRWRDAECYCPAASHPGL